MCRRGEATNPGPVIKRSTLNIVSASKNQQVLLAEQNEPTVQVFTETCMTKDIQDTLSRRTRSCKKTMIPGALCNPRRKIIRGASYTRGQSGGGFVISDLPAQPGHLPMPAATWASTRVVDAVVSVVPGFWVLGIYGISAKMKTHADMTNELLVSALGSVAHSTLPCIVMFNCPLEELVLWPSSQLRSWVDAASWNESVTGVAPAMTYRGETRIDFILMSPGLCRFWQKFRYIPATTSDHAQLKLCLQIPASPPRVLRRKTCQDSDVVFKQAHQAGWDSLAFFPPEHVSKNHGTADDLFRSFVSNFECRVSQAFEYCKSLLPLKNFLGRSCPKKILQPVHAPVVRTPRNGEPVPPVDDAPTKLRQHIRQCRSHARSRRAPWRQHWKPGMQLYTLMDFQEDL